MKQKIYRFCLSAFLYWLFTVGTSKLLIIPDEVVSPAIFLSPILGLMWGPSAAAGVCVGGLLAMPGILDFGGIAELPHLLGVAAWLFLAGYLPYFMWHNRQPEYRAFKLTPVTLWRFIAILFITFTITSIIRAATASPTELKAVEGLFGLLKRQTGPLYFCACFGNDFFITILFDLFLFFSLISRKYPFYNAIESIDETETTQDEILSREERKALMIGASCYLIFPAIVIYLDVWQIYGMDNMATWLTFLTECLITLDVYIVLITYLLLRYQRSIMLEIVFLVAMTVFASAAVLGWGSSVSMAKIVNSYVEESLHAMSVICRERLDRTFFCVRQAVSGMERQAINSVESYERLTKDSAYRENYLAAMEKGFDAIAMDTDGCLAYYLRLAPEIAGSKGGFSRVRADNRWEGALAPFVSREPIDLSRYSPDDVENIGWFYTPLKSKCATWIEPYIDTNSDEYIISYVAPLFVEGKFIGVIGIDIDFNFIVQELRRMSIYDYGYAYLTNRNNIVLYHKDRFQGSTFQPNPKFREIELYLSNGMWLGIATPLSKVHDVRNRILMHLLAAILIVAMLVSLLSIVMVSRAIRPLAGMTEAAKRIASGDLNVKISYDSGNELGILVRSIREMATKLEGYVYRDKLTGLRNAAAYMSKAADLDTQAKLIPDLTYGVVLFDVNFLKKVNDKYGHQAGNQLIRHASRVICKVFEHSPVYRVGGDEFVAILEHEDYENREELLRRFDVKIAEESFEVAGDTITLSVARGLSVYEQGMEFSAVAKKADAIMYNHKSAIKAKYGEEVR
ncbi:MAG: diguanylate cyclase [Selenomonadaceae bacterium]|nr:diguanylate cyclase [Selenomonadaceae bacterium]